MSDNHFISPEITFTPDHSGGTGRIWKTFWILLIVTLIELGLGFWIYTIHKGGVTTGPFILFLKGLMIIFTLVKAFYIVAIFMHLGDEIKNFIYTIVFPLLLFVWFIAAFLWDGASWLALRNTDAYSRPNTHQKAPAHTTDAPTVKPGDKQ